MLRIKASLQLRRSSLGFATLTTSLWMSHASERGRYKMLPLWYTLFYRWAIAGEPVVRPLFWDFLVGDLRSSTRAILGAQDDPETHENEEADPADT